MPSDDLYPYDEEKYPFALAFAGEGEVSNGWHFIRSMDYCHHGSDYCSITTNDHGVDERCCLALFCKGEIVGIGDCKNCNQVRPADIVLNDIKSRLAKNDDETSEFEVALVPNPLLDNKIRLSFDSRNIEGVDIKLFGLLHWKTLLSGHYLLNNQMVDLSVPFPPGIYFLVISDEKGNQVIKKLVKRLNCPKYPANESFFYISCVSELSFVVIL